jgi:hypothetical protein
VTKRLIFISSMGIYGETPGERYRSALDSDLYVRRTLGVRSVKRAVRMCV